MGPTAGEPGADDDDDVNDGVAYGPALPVHAPGAATPSGVPAACVEASRAIAGAVSSPAALEGACHGDAGGGVPARSARAAPGPSGEARPGARCGTSVSSSESGVHGACSAVNVAAASPGSDTAPASTRGGAATSTRVAPPSSAPSMPGSDASCVRLASSAWSESAAAPDRARSAADEESASTRSATSPSATSPPSRNAAHSAPIGAPSTRTGAPGSSAAIQRLAPS